MCVYVNAIFCTQTEAVGSLSVLMQQQVQSMQPRPCRSMPRAAGNKGEIYIELVQGFGEALVGNFPGSALRAVVIKQSLLAPCLDVSSSQSLAEALCQIPADAVRVSACPSKSVALKLPSQSSSVGDRYSHTIIFRSDSNGEDLEG